MTLLHSTCEIIQRHYSVDPKPKSALEVEAERYLFCIPGRECFYYARCVRFSRWYIFLGAFVSQFCLGSLYAWSVYNEYIDKYVTGDPTAGKAVIAFYTASGFFGVAAALLGPWLEKVGPRCGIAVGATLFLAGHIGTGFAIAAKSLAGIYISYGVVAATGMGICYISPVSTLQKWFPDLRGTAAGFAVCGFGAGPILWAFAFPYPIANWDTPISLSFAVYGGIMSFLLYMCAMVMRTPPPNFRVGGKDMHGIKQERVTLLTGPTRQSSFDDKYERPRQTENGNVILFLPEDLHIPVAEEVAHPHEFYRECDLDDAELFYFQRVKQLKLVECLFSFDFLFLWVMFLFATVFGLIIISRLKDMDVYIFSKNVNNITAADTDRAERMVSYNAIFNFFGRLLWPMLSDVVIRVFNLNPATGRKLIFFVNLSVQLVVALFLRTAIDTQNHNHFQMLVWTLTFVYGGGFGTIPCFLCDMFGAYNIGALHGIILTCWSIAGVGGGLGFTYIFDAAENNHSIGAAYDSALPLFTFGVAIGLLSLLLVRTNPVDRPRMALFHLVCSIIQRHWSVTPPTKTPAEVEAEKYLICIPAPFDNDSFYFARCIRFSRWYIFLSAFLSQFCLGSLYAWSVYNEYIDRYVTGDPTAGKAVIAFYTASGCFGLAAALLGPWLEKVGPRRGIATGAILFLLGHVGAGVAISMKSMAGIYISYGVVGGVGMGLCYSSPIATLQKWFPDLRGTASGFAVCGFGAGPVLWAVLFPYPIDAWGTQLYISFPAFGILMGLVLIICAMVMRNPPSSFRIHGKDMHGIYHESINLLENESDTYRSTSLKDRRKTPTEAQAPRQTQNGNVILFLPEDLNVPAEDLNIPVAEEAAHPHEFYRECELDDAELFYFQRVKQLKLVDCLFSLDFLFLWITFLFATVFGLIIISRLKDMDVYIFSAHINNITTADTDRAERMVSYNAIFNFFGRLIWPVLSDVGIRVLSLNPATGRKLIFFVNLSVQLVVALFLRSAIDSQNHSTFQALVWTLTFVYGGGFGTIPCFLCDMFGAYNIGALHGIILTCWAIAGVGGGLGFTFIFDAAENNHSIRGAYDSSMPLFAIGVCIGLLSLLLVRTNPVDRFAPGLINNVLTIIPKTKSLHFSLTFLPTMTIFQDASSVIQRHWTVAPPTKSAAEEEAEKYLICIPSLFAKEPFYFVRCIRFSRWYIFVAAFLAQFCLGSLYAWSVYNQYIDQYVTGDDNAGKAVIAFYVATGAFGLTAALFGPWLEKVGPRRGIATGALFFLVGHIGTGIAIAMKSMAGIYFSYGVVGGIGIGLCYSSPIATLQKWFPDLRGTASGFAVCGFGAGPVLWAVLFPYPLDAWGAKLYISFPAFGIFMSLILFICAMVMRNPPSNFRIRGKDMHGIYHGSVDLLENESDTYRSASSEDRLKMQTENQNSRKVPNGNIVLFVLEDLNIPVAEEIPHPHEFYRECELDDIELFYFQRVRKLKLVDCLFSFDFFFLWTMFLFATIFGLVIISRLKDMDVYIFSSNINNITSADTQRAERMVSYNGIFNFLGRLIWPVLSDVCIRVFTLNPATGRKLIFFVILTIQLVGALFLRSVIDNKNHANFQALVWILTFVYGGGYGTIPCFLCDMFGAYNIGALHGIILTGTAIAGVGGGLLFTSIFDAAKINHSTPAAYDNSMPFFTFGAGLSLLALLLVRTNPVDRFSPGYQFSVGRYMLFYNTIIDNSLFGNQFAGHAVLTFYIACGFLGFSAASLGPWLERIGPRLGVFIGTSFFLSGHLFTAISLKFNCLTGVYFSYGILVGIGSGICYIAPVSTLQQWFPDLRGTAAGFAVCGFGAGPILWSKAFPWLINSVGVPLHLAFAIWGGIMACVMYICALILRSPPPNYTINGRDVHGISVHANELYCEQELDPSDLFYFRRIKQLELYGCLLSWDYAFLWFMFVLQIAFGLVILSRLSDMDSILFPDANIDVSARSASMVSYTALFNFAGRLIWPMASDFLIKTTGWNPAFGRKAIFLLLFLVQMIIAWQLPVSIQQQKYNIFRALVWMLTLVYGGGFGTIPCFLCDMFGVYNVAALHGIILSSWSIAAIAGGLTFTFEIDHAKNSRLDTLTTYEGALQIFLVGAGIGIAALILVRTNPVDRFATKYQISFANHRIFPWWRHDEPTSHIERVSKDGESVIFIG
ncbi:Major Facilitator Superfamily (MFS) [Thraustotheca clavata]|uniref:Major Facilitator Superfamily (MFS) n=1 Tax=Thraustotheca clavata TaxID=74557 RepID=A0A1W0A7T1_9STRA|nr:Major Facilitator Superfamily (MFS) [Thraustotheca clavata]